MRVLPLALFLILLFGCTDKPDHSNTARGFYYWQTSLSEFDWTDSVYQSMNVRKVFYRFFDVAWSAEAKAPVPVSPLVSGYSNWVPQKANIPVVFITNGTFKNLNHEQSVQLAHQVHRKVMMRISSVIANSRYEDPYNWSDSPPYQIRPNIFNEISRHDSLFNARMKLFTEIQFDCDWTKTTRENYFAFLEESKKLFSQQQVTSTIRLYQYKYPKEAGVPPVTRGMLMCYNAGDIRDPKTRNSIFDKDEIMSYLEDVDGYTVPLDYALPIFQWALLFKDNKLTAILPTSVIRDNITNLATEDNISFTVQQEFVSGFTDDAIFIRSGNIIRVESPDLNDVMEVAAWLGKHKNNTEAILTLYHLNTYDLQKHSKEIESIFNSF